MIYEDENIRSLMSLLDSSPVSELQALLDNEQQLADMVADFKNGHGGPYGVHESERQLLQVSNKSAAEYNLKMEPRLQEARRKLEDSYMTANQIYKRVKEKEAKLENATGGTSIENAFDQLRIASQMSEEESEGIADKFISGQMGIDSFLGTFEDKRKDAHLKKVKSEKMHDLVEEKRQQLRTVPSRPAPPRPTGANLPPYPISNLPYPTSAPYPMGNMPLPPYPIGSPFPRF